jgi:hypothetical protein
MISRHPFEWALLMFATLLMGNVQAGVPVVGYLTGNPTQMAASPLATKDFGSSPVGTPVAGAQETVTVDLSGGGQLQITGIAATGDFSVTGGTCTNPSTTYSNGNTCTLDLQFAPTAVGTRNGQLNVTCQVVAAAIGVVGVLCDGNTYPAYNLTGNGLLAAIAQAIPTLGREGITLLALMMIVVSLFALRRR